MKTSIIENKIDLLDRQIENAEFERATLIEQLENSKKIGTSIESWLGNVFESSCSRTEEFKSFERDFKKTLKNLVGDEFEIIGFGGCHFFLTGFLKHRRTGKYVYFSTSDVRFSRDDWYNNVLVRTAQHDKDYTGGGNNYCSLPEINIKALKLIGEIK